MSEGIGRARREENVVAGGGLVRHHLVSRMIHWSVAAAFFACLLTGLPIWWPPFGWLAYLFGGLYACRVIHPWAGACFFTFSAIMFLHWVKEMMLDERDRGWLGPKLIEYLRFRGDDPEAGKYNGGQKLFFFFEAVCAFVLFASGFALWFPREIAQTWREVSILGHDVSFIFATIGIIAHIYLGTAAEPGTFRAMVIGTVSKDWARLHHPRWFREVTREDDRA
jgi:formate dehydrogenase subunit gamma